MAILNINAFENSAWEVYVSANRTFLTLENAQNYVLNAHIEGVTNAQTVICESTYFAPNLWAESPNLNLASTPIVVSPRAHLTADLC